MFRRAGITFKNILRTNILGCCLLALDESREQSIECLPAYILIYQHITLDRPKYLRYLRRTSHIPVGYSGYLWDCDHQTLCTSLEPRDECTSGLWVGYSRWTSTTIKGVIPSELVKTLTKSCWLYLPPSSKFGWKLWPYSSDVGMASLQGPALYEIGQHGTGPARCGCSVVWGFNVGCAAMFGYTSKWSWTSGPFVFSTKPTSLTQNQLCQYTFLFI